jgi:hypothetical protein
MSVSDLKDYESLADTAAKDVADRFKVDLAGLFEEAPEVFEGRSTSAEWQSQVNNAKEWLQDAIRHVILTEVEMAETRLHDGEFLDATVACKQAAGMV